MQPSSIKRRSRSNPVRKSAIEREDKSLTRNDQRRTQTLKSKGISTGENSHIPRPRFRSSSSDRAGSLGRKSYLKATGRTPLLQPTTPVTPMRISTRLNVQSLALTASSGRIHVSIPVGRSPSGDRVSSVGAKGPRKDTRPLMDKTYQMALLNKIDNFFYMKQLTLNDNGSLKPITLRIFMEVSGFLLNSFDVKHDLTMANYIDELPKYAKKLHYPGLMTKSWLKTANTMHSWPNVLGWIGWLVEACQVREIAKFNRHQLDTLPFIGMDQQAQSCNKEFQALLEGYKAWNDEKLDEEAEILERYLQNILIQQGLTDEAVAQTHKELDKEEIKLQMHEEESRKLDEKIEHLQQTLTSFRAKEFQQLNNIRTMDDDTNKLSTETSQLNTECEVLNEQIRIGNMKYEELNSVVKNQPMSKTEKENIVKKYKEIQNYIHQFDEHLKDYEKEKYTLDIKLAAINNDLNKAILAYNKKVFLDIDIDVGLNFNELKLPEKGFLNAQMMDVIKAKISLIKTFKEKFMKQCNETESLVRSDTIKLEKLQEEIKALPDENKLKEEIAHINEMKADMKKEKVKITKQIEDLRNKIKEIQDMMSGTRRVDSEVEEAQDKLDAVIRRKTFLEQSAKRFFEELYNIIGEQREAFYNILTKDRSK